MAARVPIVLVNGEFQQLQAGDTLTVGGSGTTWLNGAIVPSAGTGSDGNYYLNTATGDIYLKAAGSWSLVAPDDAFYCSAFLG